MTDCLIPATGPCTAQRSGPCLPIHVFDPDIAALKNPIAHGTPDGIAVTWTPLLNVTPPDQKVLMRVENAATGAMMQQTLDIWRNSYVAFYDLKPDARVGDKYFVYLKPHTDTQGGHWQKIEVGILAPDTSSLQVLQSAVQPHDPYNIMVVVNQPIVLGNNIFNRFFVTIDGVDHPARAVDPYPGYSGHAFAIRTDVPFFPGQALTWHTTDGTTIQTTAGAGLVPGNEYPVTNNSQLLGRAFSDGFSFGFQ